MTDNTPTPATPNELLSENHDLLYKLLAVIETHIAQLVERKVQQIFESHATMALIDEKTKDLLEEMIDEKLTEHVGDYDHESRDDISDTVATHIAHHDFSDNIRRSVEEIMSDGDYATEERVQEMIDGVDHEEKVKEVLRNI